MNSARLLLADPDCDFRGPLAEGLAQHGFAVSHAANVKEALGILSCEQHQYLVCELRFDNATGIDLIAHFSAQAPDGRALILSAFGDLRHVTAAVRAGAVDFLVKPASVDIVAQALNTPPGERIPPPKTAPSAEEVRWNQIDRVLRDCEGCVTEAARRLDIHRRTLQRIMRRRGIPPTQ